MTHPSRKSNIALAIICFLSHSSSVLGELSIDPHHSPELSSRELYGRPAKGLDCQSRTVRLFEVELRTWRGAPGKVHAVEEHNVTVRLGQLEPLLKGRDHLPEERLLLE